MRQYQLKKITEANFPRVFNSLKHELPAKQNVRIQFELYFKETTMPIHY